MTLLTHRGYHGSIEASPKDDCLYGKLLFVRALVNYEGKTVAELASAFREAVDDYLDTCAEQGKAPEVPCKGSFNVRVGHDLHMAASLEAARQKITLNDLTRRALSEYLSQHA
ncbi:type II toxin-antitoxin system HicB family antitoxin [Stutzerimonas kirkiae]|uniref:Toxin-antitoxin system HicB family antitoxin n=1 Tax=Stutzerimonas kirkiae TaxID=2211392 RepID=A0A4V2KD94_9GAMM|nr:type II toxin-antitoxin system HicB family antitoxin [Stutzerimonas kirkiae]TBU98111.1 toxin-antitoxin system HicB family antitoxin [Stutzerimonas kirkiae]TBV02374.1 toxin-antitoxin system HicB family antitoxin [Stutzerimonas kirkiae]TBV11163.1 toxin-antitoxin system HicB family antitoxin [Stutzerimonas kirkiae]TBV14685.1 toxin-antitoxin system HicB family antitoxin [Stutzerimonas kirkiae]